MFFAIPNCTIHARFKNSIWKEKLVNVTELWSFIALLVIISYAKNLYILYIMFNNKQQHSMEVISLKQHYKEVTDGDLDDIIKQVKNAGEMLQLASLSLRACFIDNSSSVKSFVEIRSEVTNEARVYGYKILPFAHDVVRTIQNFCENYQDFTFEEFKEYITDLADEANENAKLCKYTLELHKSILTEFKKKEDKAKTVLKQLKLEAEEFEKRKEALLNSANQKYAWAIGLSLVPGVNLIATPILLCEGNKDIAKSIAASEEKLLAVAAIDAIRDPLCNSIDNFVKSLSKISGFFQLLTDELIFLAQNHKENPKKMHYNRIKKKSLHIVEACRQYSFRIPDSETNLRAIPETFDNNYVQEWLSRREAEIDNEKLSFIKWGEKLLKSNKKLMNLITAELYCT
ncbi:hypothetical protein C1645_754584 [Glomus cerebriforme]|uniref:Uncharacterized protein n=1 Tax=Glomus cerebriforme TaxID=658196 RepID=A0A397TGS6_9GLOM|nr:hypothetical protein C1645_754584 [Glomus cerebriforme]